MEINKLLKKKGHKQIKIGENPFAFLTYCELDLSDWLREQSLKTIQTIANHVFFGHIYKEGDRKKIQKKKSDWVKQYAS